MQAVINNNSALGAFHFAGGRGYMMRSEKRDSSGPVRKNTSGGSRPPRKRKKRAGFFYKVFMMILLLTIWPIGLMMLWQRKVRWGALTKLLTSVVTLAACIVLLGFALTVNTGNPEYTAVQDRINSFLDIAADSVINAGDVIADRAEIVAEGAVELYDVLWEDLKVDFANGIDAAVLLGQRAKTQVNAWIDSFDIEPAVPAEPTEAPALVEATEEPTPEPTAEPTPEPTPEVYSFAVKSAADATVYYNQGGKCYHMRSACGSMTTSVEHTLGETKDENNHRCSVCGTPDKSILDEEFVVWVDDENVAHLSDECQWFSGNDWKLIPAAEATQSDMLSCPECEADAYLAALAAGKPVTTATPEPTAEPTPEPTEEPTEAPSAEPTEAAAEEAEAIAEETEAPAEAAVALPEEIPVAEEAAEAEPTGEPEVPAEEEPVEEATEIETELPVIAEPAETEEAETVASAVPAAAETQQPAATEVPEPTELPEPELILPNVMLKPAGEATVYHSLTGDRYHSFNRCAGMVGGGAYTLAECAETHSRCPACGAPAAELIGQSCLWMDEASLCHTSDTCASFTGDYTLILRDDALEAGFSGCTSCGAHEYLIPNTIIQIEDVVAADTAE